MNTSTLSLSKLLKGVVLVAAFGVGSLVADAQTFAYNGLIYKNTKGQLSIMKPGTAVTVGEAGPTEYSGDIKVPANITYNGTDYHVNTFNAQAFKNQPVTSVEFEDGSITTLPRGGFMYTPTLKKVVLPEGLTKIDMQAFQGCYQLEEIVIPSTVTNDLVSQQFATYRNIGTDEAPDWQSSLKRIVIKEGATPLAITTDAFKNGTDPNSMDLVETVEIYRQLNTDSKYQTMTLKPFRGAKALKTLTIGGTFVNYPASFFENAANLASVTIQNTPETFNTNLFAATAITSFDYPASITELPASIFQNCKKLRKVTIPEGITTISTMAFLNSSVADINFPSTLTSIGSMAFSGTGLSGDISFTEGLKSIGTQAFANAPGITSVTMPASLTTLGDGAFMGSYGIKKFAIAEGNANYKTDATSSYITNIEGNTLISFAPACALTELKGNFTTVYPYACYKATGLKVIDLPACENWGDYALSETGISTISLKGTIGRYVAKGTPITSITLDKISEVPFGVAMDCKQLTDVKVLTPFTIVKQDAFHNCTALESLDLGNILAILEADCFTGSGIKTLTVAAANPAGMAENVFTEQSGYTVKVPASLVDTYKNAAGWSLLNIVGDENIAAGPADMGMPNGLYYAGEDGNLHAVYADGGTDVYDVGGAPHTFQLSQFKNRIYGASAGKKFVYSLTAGSEGDGKLFYISQVGGNIFQAVVLDNYGLNAYKDPFGLYIYGDDLFVSDRNVAIRKVKADAIALNSATYPSWMENNWMGFYNQEWTYGNIKSGWSITQGPDNKPLYWLAIKFNGMGIYRFTDENVGSADKLGSRPENGVFLNQCAPIITTIFIDEAHKHLYVYLETDGGNEENVAKGGVYRIGLDELEANPNPARFNDLNWVLVDGSPVKYEGSSTNEHVGISQFSADEKGEYLYWCYRAPSADEAAANEAQDFIAQKSGKYWWAEKYDANNPLHQSGIKRIKLGEAQPKVEMVAPGVNGYGVVPVNYEGSTKPSQGVQDIIINNTDGLLTVNAGVITVAEDAVVTVYNMSGLMVNYATVAAGESLSTADLPAGAYIVTAKIANGTTAVAKLVK